MQNPILPCGCGQPVPPSPPPRGGFLMQQIIGAGRAYLRYERFSLFLSDLPCDARPPLQLSHIWAQECGIRTERQESPCGRGLTMLAHIPLRCTVCDAGGCSFTAASHIDVPVQMRVYDLREADRAQATAAAFVRLVRPCGCSQNPLEAWLDVSVEIWLTACRPMFAGECPPTCPPPLPLYPQPFRR